MLFVRLLMTDESAHETVKALGEFGMFHFVEVEGSQQSDQYMAYKKRVAICSSWEKRLHDFTKSMVQNDVQVPGPEVRPQLLHGDVVVGAKTFVEAVEHELEQHLESKKQFETLVNEAREKKQVLLVCRDALPFHRAEVEQKNEGKKESGEDVELKKKGAREERKTPLLKDDDRTDDDQKEIGRAVQQECRDRSRMPSSA
eukprot:TRINITY_DN9923_c0_g2_i1.p1 TRINITY_DN9923_c0_g2~~TRINITY_DN9923_c0_g2_i1.p1  ORF type:complete len:230 (-),score=43.56 TRINITY_DN9923_c0_g2_i1:11-610(-)